MPHSAPSLLVDQQSSWPTWAEGPRLTHEPQTLAQQAAPWAPKEAASVRFLAGSSDALELYQDDAETRGRAKVLRWMSHDIRTRTGTSRRDRIAGCGILMAARQGNKLGLAHRWCRDIFCPGCVKRRQAKLSKFLQCYVDHAHANGRIVLFMTLTQVKLPIEHESCAQAIDRVLSSRRAMFNEKTSAARDLRELVVGGVNFLESSWSYRNKRNRDGSRVAYSGWHAHLHGLVEIAPPPPT